MTKTNTATETDVDGALTLVMERELPHPAEKVWRALTQSALMADWLLPNDFAAEQGRHFQLRTQPMPQWNGIVDCQVLEMQPHQRLSYSWNVGDDGAGALRTVVTFTLTPTASGVRLRMEQSGFREDQQRNLHGAKYGWTGFLEGLLRVVDRL